MTTAKATYVAHDESNQLTLGTWMVRAIQGLKEKGVRIPDHGGDADGKHYTMYNIGELYRLVQHHQVHIDRSGYLTETGLVVDSP